MFVMEGGAVDPITLIVTALVAGAAAGATDVAGSAVRDAYAAFKGLLQRRLARRPAGEVVLEQHEQQPDVYEGPLKHELAESGADRDTELLEAARQLLELADPQGTASGKYAVKIGTAQGVQIGDHNKQENQWGA
jgi:RIP homotypic interaction motif